MVDGIEWGIDVSDYQGLVNMRLMREHGATFGIVKCTEGASWRGQYFRQNFDALAGEGMERAAYHYMRGNNSAASQYDNIAYMVPGGSNVIPDLEAGGGGVDLVRDLVGRLTRAGFKVPLSYIPGWYWRQIGSPSLQGLPPLWQSWYPDNVRGYLSAIYQKVPASAWNGFGGLGIQVLQFTSSGDIGGRYPIDGNAFRGSRQALSALFNGSVAAPGGIETMGFKDGFTDWAGNPQTVESWMNHVDERVLRTLDAVAKLADRVEWGVIAGMYLGGPSTPEGKSMFQLLAEIAGKDSGSGGISDEDAAEIARNVLDNLPDNLAQQIVDEQAERLARGSE